MLIPKLKTSLWCIVILITLILTHTKVVKAQDARTLYASYCAGCHGASLRGNSATPLIKRTWTYGRGKGQIIRNITYGIAGTEMVSWKGVLSSEQIESLATFIGQAQTTPLTKVPPIPSKIQTDAYILKVEKVVESGLTDPWGIAFIDTHTALITERGGGLRVFTKEGLTSKPVANTPTPMQTRIGGLMGIALDPSYSSNGWVYLSMSHTSGDPHYPNAPGMTRIIRGRVEDHTWVDQETVFQVPDSLQVANGHRWGGPLLFDGEGYLYFTIGDLAEGAASQDVQKAHGKTFRINPDGTSPLDNPFLYRKGALPEIFTIGNRNTQGLAVHPETGEIWSTDHGPMGGDEINVLRKGANYGWPIITYGIDYSGAIVSHKTHQEGMESPITYWTPSIAVSEIEFIESPLFPEWQNHLLVGALAYEEVRRVELAGDSVLTQEIILKGYGRVRDIEINPDGSIYVLLNSPDMLVRLTPERVTKVKQNQP